MGTTRRSIPGCWRSFPTPHSRCVPAGSPLAGRQIAPAELLGQKIIYTEPGCPYRRLLERFLEDQELSPEVFLETGSADVVLRFVEAGLGIGFMPEFISREKQAAHAVEAFGIAGFEPGCTAGSMPIRTSG